MNRSKQTHAMYLSMPQAKYRLAIDISLATNYSNMPPESKLKSTLVAIGDNFFERGLFEQTHFKDFAELSLRLVDAEEIQQLNKTYRGKNKPTNVLSFPVGQGFNPEHLLGDLVICAEIVADEAHSANLALEAHWTHMLVHGVLHLLGFDHESNDQAEEMEGLEVALLEQLGFSSPYCISS